MIDQALNHALACEVMGYWCDGRNTAMWRAPEPDEDDVAFIFSKRDWNPTKDLNQLAQVVRKAREIVGDADHIRHKVTMAILGLKGTCREDEILFAMLDHPTLVAAACIEAVREVRKS